MVEDGCAADAYLVGLRAYVKIVLVRSEALNLDQTLLIDFCLTERLAELEHFHGYFQTMNRRTACLGLE